MRSLENKTALVTGASRGIGRATALALAEAGAHVLVHYGRSAAEAKAVVAAIQAKGGRAEAIANIDALSKRDVASSRPYGVFDADGTWLAGNIHVLPLAREGKLRALCRAILQRRPIGEGRQHTTLGPDADQDGDR